MVDLAIESRDVVTPLRRDDQIVGGTARSEGARVVRRFPGIACQDVLDHRIEAILRDDVAGERIAHPGAVLHARGARIVDGEPPSAEVEVARVHVWAWHVADESLRDLFVMALEAAEEERLVLAVVNAWDSDRSTCRGAHFVVTERIAG